MKKTKVEDTLSGTPKKKKPENKGRLSSMLESMQKRSSPVNAHKVATKYFDDFRKERGISTSKKPPKDTTAVATGVITAERNAVSTAVTTALSTAVGKEPRKSTSFKAQNKTIGSKYLDDSHSLSESRVYWTIYNECIARKSKKLRFGLKELKEKIGLSDKTIRVAIHSLEKKLSIEVVEPSLGVYGRMIQVFEPEEVVSNRKKAGLIIESVTKKIVDRGTAVLTAVDSAVVDKENYKNEIKILYKKYTNNDWDEKAEKFYKTIEHLKPEIVESAFIVGILKEKRNDKHISDFKNLFKELDNELPKAYIGHLRVIWKEFQTK
ncbi:MAG: hypothetical protein IH823_00055 [Candidatus Dadabacteria bacterium]|nr:hypothetical protein [Candidatus Dadabacteria bacterium]